MEDDLTKTGVEGNATPPHEDGDTYVCRQLSYIRRDYREADTAILDGIDKLREVIAGGNVAYAAVTPSGLVWKRQSIMNIFVELLDPVLLRLFPSPHFVRHELVMRAADLPLAPHLTKKDHIKAVAKHLLQVSVDYEHHHADGKPDEWDEMVMKGSSLLAAQEAMGIISSQFEQEEVRWCGLCFRRAPDNSDYCDLHRRKQESALDVDYRKGYRISWSIPYSLLRDWEQNRSLRRVLREDFKLIAEPRDVPDNVMDKFYQVTPTFKQVNDLTVRGPWHWVAQDWDELLDDYCPHVRQKCPRSAMSFQTWDEFVQYLLENLHNKHEGTRNPLWIYYMLLEAEVWFEFEAKDKDGRVTDSAERIEELFRSGVTNAAEIAREIGKTRQYVTKVLKGKGLR